MKVQNYVVKIQFNGQVTEFKYEASPLSSLRKFSQYWYEVALAQDPNAKINIYEQVEVLTDWFDVE